MGVGWCTWVVTGVFAVGALALALLVSTYMGAAFGVQAALLALLVSAVPLLIVIPTFIWLDRFEAEPTRYLVAAFLWGPGGRRHRGHDQHLPRWR